MNVVNVYILKVQVKGMTMYILSHVLDPAENTEEAIR